MIKPLLLLTLLSCALCGCAAHKPVHNDKVGAQSSASHKHYWCYQWGDKAHGAEPTTIGLALNRIGLTKLLGVKCEAQEKESHAAPPKIGAPPYFEGGEWKCGNNHYKYRPLTTECEREQ